MRLPRPPPARTLLYLHRVLNAGPSVWTVPPQSPVCPSGPAESPCMSLKKAPLSPAAGVRVPSWSPRRPPLPQGPRKNASRGTVGTTVPTRLQPLPELTHAAAGGGSDARGHLVSRVQRVSYRFYDNPAHVGIEVTPAQRRRKRPTLTYMFSATVTLHLLS